jgi:hypothetical protein
VRIKISIGLAAAAAAFGLGIAIAADGESAERRPCDASVSTAVPQPTRAQLEAAGLAELPLAPDSARTDLTAPAFSTPTEISNPLFPISDLRSAILNGTVDGLPFKTETTLLPETMIMEWSDGQCVEVLVSQYLAYIDGRIEEVALDRYAQADDGSVWYLGEDVFNYDDGVVGDLAGSWLAGIDGPAAMIMPADPKVGTTYRPENIAGLVFEEVTVEEVGKTVDGPRGPVQGAITVRELHDDGSTEEKIFAPGYGEFFTGSGGDVEALAVAVPTDSLSGGMPAALGTLEKGAAEVFNLAAGGRWNRAARTVAQMTDAWAAHRAAGAVPPRLIAPTNRAVAALGREVAARGRAGARQAAVGMAQAAYDLQLQYRPSEEVDRGRFDAWLRQVLVDVDARDQGALLGDVATLEWIRDRIEKAFDPVGLTRLDTLLRDLRVDAGDEDYEAISATVAELRELVAV